MAKKKGKKKGQKGRKGAEAAAPARIKKALLKTRA